VPPRAVLRRLLPQRQRLLPVAPPPKQPLCTYPRSYSSTCIRSGEAAACVNEPHRPASTQCTTSSSSACGSGVDDDGQCDDGGFELDTASVVSEAAVERKEVRRVRPVLSELQCRSEWQELAVDRRSRCQIWSSFCPPLFLLLAGYENLTAPNAIMQS
jgi:hypothetical protein